MPTTIEEGWGTVRQELEEREAALRKLLARATRPGRATEDLRRVLDAAGAAEDAREALGERFHPPRRR